MQGYDTLDPVTELVAAIRRGSREFSAIPNLLYKAGGEVQATGFTHSRPRITTTRAMTGRITGTRPNPGPAASKLIMTLPNTGCVHDCGWCGGSNSHPQHHGCAQDPRPEGQRPHRRCRLPHHEGGGAAHLDIRAPMLFGEQGAAASVSRRCQGGFGYASVSFEQFNLTPPDTLRKMGESTDAYIMLSPESHDPKISAAAGRGTYTMEEMEDWIPPGPGRRGKRNHDLVLHRNALSGPPVGAGHCRVF